MGTFARHCALPQRGCNGFLQLDSHRVRVNEAWALLETALPFVSPAHVFFLFSGGYDSLVATHLSEALLRDVVRMYAAQLPEPLPQMHVMHINTGIGVPQTRTFVRTVAQQTYQWDYLEYTTPESYEAYVLAYGFPGPAMHWKMYALLKERALRLAIHDHTPPHPFEVNHSVLTELFNEMQYLPPLHQYVILRLIRRYLTRAITAYRQALRPMLFITGVRRQESARRRGTAVPLQKHGRHWWASPLTSWSKEDVLDYMEAEQMPHNPMVDVLHKSSECLCGAFAHAGELEELCFWYPEVGAYIKALEQQVGRKSFVWGWEEGPPRWWTQAKRGQLMLPGCEEYMLATQQTDDSTHFSPLCSSCAARQEALPSAATPAGLVHEGEEK